MLHQAHGASLAERRPSTRRGAERCRARSVPAQPSPTPQAEYLRYIEIDRGRKTTTVHDYRSVIDTHLLPAFRDARLEDIAAPQIERWLGTLRC